MSESGTGMIGTLAGTAALLFFLLLAAHVLVHLYATSVATAVAFDAARIVSGSDGGPAAEASALEHARGLLGAWADQVDLAFTHVDEEQVVVRVQATSPALLPQALNQLRGVAGIDREVIVRTERFR